MPVTISGTKKNKFMRYLSFVIVIFLSACFQNDSKTRGDNAIALNDTIIKKDQLHESAIIASAELDSVLILYSDSIYKLGGSFTVYNADNSVFASIVSDGKEEPAADKELNKNILTYFPFYFAIHFKAASMGDSSYTVMVGDKYKIIRKGQYTQLLSWPQYILKYLCAADKDNPLRKSPDDNSPEIKNLAYDELSFKAIEIKGDWINVRCFFECEGCPESNKKLSGWIRWRKEGEIIIHNYYGC